MDGTVLALIAVALIPALGCLLGAITPRYVLAITRWWYELCGMNYDALVKSERRQLIMTRIVCVVGFVVLSGMMVFVYAVMSRL